MSDLRNSFGSQHLFLDMETIEAGSDFANIIERALDGCEVLLAVIGPTWLSVSNQQGLPRIFEPEDFITLEIASALKRNIPVIPVLMNTAVMPKAEHLPESIQALSSLQAVSMSLDRWDNDMEKLVAAIDNLTVAPRLARQYDAAKDKFKQGYWQDALSEWRSIETVNPGYANISEVIQPLRSLEQDLTHSGPEIRLWQRIALKFPIPIILIVTLVPHLLAAAFNYLFNWLVIVHPLQLRGVENAEYFFEMCALWVNSVLFLVGIVILILLVMPISKALKELSSGSAASPERMTHLRKRCLRLGHLIALFGLSVWIAAGPLYPILIGALAIRDYFFFIASLAISGLAVAAYPFMIVTWLCTHVYYRQLVIAGLNADNELKILDRIDSMKWKYFLLTGALPMLVISLGFIIGPMLSSPQSVSTLLGTVGLVGLAGFLLALTLFKAIQNDLKLLRQLLWACASK